MQEKRITIAHNWPQPKSCEVFWQWFPAVSTNERHWPSYPHFGRPGINYNTSETKESLHQKKPRSVLQLGMFSEIVKEYSSTIWVRVKLSIRGADYVIIVQVITRKTSPIGPQIPDWPTKNPCEAREWIWSFHCSCGDEINENWVSTCSASLLFSRFGSLRL